jgi:hypothetical protein
MWVMAGIAVLNIPSECDADTKQKPRRCLSREECLAKGGYFVDCKVQKSSCYLYYQWNQWKW